MLTLEMLPGLSYFMPGARTSHADGVDQFITEGASKRILKRALDSYRTTERPTHE
jgi:hypothetical protein